MPSPQEIQRRESMSLMISCMAPAPGALCSFRREFPPRIGALVSGDFLPRLLSRRPRALSVCVHP